MKRGLNHNIEIFGKVFHIQTEATDVPTPHLDTHVFLEGQVLQSFRNDLSPEDAATTEALDLAIRKQHKEAARALLGGHVWRPAGAPEPRPLPEPGPRKALPAPAAARNLPTGAFSLENMLAIRRAAVSLARRLERPPGEAGELARALSHLATPISLFISKWTDCCRLDEIADLHLLRDELRTHLAGDQAGDLEAGLALWSSLSEVANQLTGINQRKDILEHDLEAACRLLGRYFGGADAPELIAEEDIQLLHSLQGRDPDLDALVEGEQADGLRYLPPMERRPTEALRRNLEYIRSQVQHEPAGP